MGKDNTQFQGRLVLVQEKQVNPRTDGGDLMVAASLQVAIDERSQLGFGQCANFGGIHGTIFE